MPWVSAFGGGHEKQARRLAMLEADIRALHQLDMTCMRESPGCYEIFAPSVGLWLGRHACRLTQATTTTQGKNQGGGGNETKKRQVREEKNLDGASAKGPRPSKHKQQIIRSGTNTSCDVRPMGQMRPMERGRLASSVSRQTTGGSRKPQARTPITTRLGPSRAAARMESSLRMHWIRCQLAGWLAGDGLLVWSFGPPCRLLLQKFTPPPPSVGGLRLLELTAGRVGF